MQAWYHTVVLTFCYPFCLCGGDLFVMYCAFAFCCLHDGLVCVCNFAGFGFRVLEFPTFAVFPPLSGFLILPICLGYLGLYG